MSSTRSRAEAREQPVARLERAAGRADVLADQEHVLVGGERVAHRARDRLLVGRRAHASAPRGAGRDVHVLEARGRVRLGPAPRALERGGDGALRLVAHRVERGLRRPPRRPAHARCTRIGSRSSHAPARPRAGSSPGPSASGPCGGRSAPRSASGPRRRGPAPPRSRSPRGRPARRCRRSVALAIA